MSPKTCQWCLAHPGEVVRDSRGRGLDISGDTWDLGPPDFRRLMVPTPAQLRTLLRAHEG